MKILNFGSINIDFVYRVDDFLQPGETKHSKSRNIFSGGKGFNQSISLAKAGVNVYHAGAISKEDTFLLKQLEEVGVDTSLIDTGDTFTGHTIIQVTDKGENCILLSGGANQTITKEYVDLVLSNFEKDDLILLQNEISMLDYIIDKAYEKRMKIALNPSPFHDDLLGYNLNKVDYFLINEVEGKQITNLSQPKEIAQNIIDRYPKAMVVLTLGGKGAIYKDSSNYFYHGIYKTEVVDTTAAGDTFTGYFMASIYRDNDILGALKTASMASAISITRNGAGVSIPFMSEVEDAVQNNTLGSPISFDVEDMVV